MSRNYANLMLGGSLLAMAAVSPIFGFSFSCSAFFFSSAMQVAMVVVSRRYHSATLEPDLLTSPSTRRVIEKIDAIVNVVADADVSTLESRKPELY